MNHPALILVGLSAVGKTTVMHLLCEKEPAFRFVRSVTTRPPRFAGDTEYLYLSEEAFSRAKESGELLESAVYGSYAYGTPRTEVERIRTEGGVPLMILNMEGNLSLRQGPLAGEVLSVYLYDDINPVEQRLYDREFSASPGIDGFLSFQRRKEANIRDCLSLPGRTGEFDVFVHNTTPEEASDLILSYWREGVPAKAKEEKNEIAANLAAQATEKVNYTVADRQ